MSILATAFNIFFKISQPLYGEIIKISLEINRRFDSSFVVDGEVYFPHLPLYLFAAPLKNRAKIIKAGGRECFFSHSQEYHHLRHPTYYQKTQHLTNFHQCGILSNLTLTAKTARITRNDG